jgi:hypothetical protein
MKFNLFNLPVFGAFVVFSAFTTPSNLNPNIGKPTKSTVSNSNSSKKTLVLEITGVNGQEIEFSAFIRQGKESYRIDKAQTPYRLEIDEPDFSGVFHKLSENGQWVVKAEKFLGEHRLTDVKGDHSITVVESSEHTIESWGM